MKGFLRSAFFISVGGALPLLSSLVLLIPYTENLDTSHYGALAIFISFTLLVQILMNFGIDTYMSVHYYDHKDTESLKKLLRSVSGLLLLIGAGLILLFSVSGYFLFVLIFPDGNISFFPFGFMSVVTAFCNAYFRAYVNLQIYGDKPGRYFLFGLFNFVVTVLLSTILVYQYPFELTGPVWGRLLSGILIFLLTFYFSLREFGISFKIPFLREIKTYTTPVVIFSLLTWVLGYINTYILNAFESTSEVGVYDFALKCTLIIEYAIIGLLSTINPRIYQIWKNKEIKVSSAEENRYNHVFSAFNIVFIALNILLLPFIIRLVITNTGYHESIVFLPILCASFAFRGLYNTLINPLYYFKRTKVLPRILLISAVIQIVSGVILIKYFGIWGAVWSYFLVKPLQLLFIWWESRKFFTFRFNVFKMIMIPVMHGFVIIFLTQITAFNEYQIAVIQLIVATLLVGFGYRKEIRDLKRILFTSKEF